MKNRISRILGNSPDVPVLENDFTPVKINKWLYVGTFLLFFVLSSLAFNMLSSDRHQQEIKNQESLINVTKQAVEQGFYKSATLVFNNIVNRPVYRQALYEANEATPERQHEIRQQIYRSLLPVYESMESFRLKQLHFHLHNNESFLRFHRPLKFGDNLTAIRSTVAYVNRTGQPITGFEEGRIYNGFRFVFPMFWNDKPAGSVETSVAMNTILSEMSQELKQRVGFIILKDVVERKVFKSERSNYIETPFSKDFLYERNLDKKHCCEYLNRIMSGWGKATQLKNWLDSEKIKTHFIRTNGQDHLLSFLPVKNPISLETVGYIIVHKEHGEHSEIQMQFIGFWAVSVFIALVLTFLLYVLKRDEQQLQIKNHLIEAQNELFAKTQEIVHVGTWEFNVKHNRLYWSDEVFRIMGYAPQSFIPTFERFLSCVHPEDRDRVEQAYNKSLENQENYEIEHRVMTTGANERYVVEECEHVFDGQGEVVRSVGTIHDITALRRNEQNLRRLKDRYKKLLEDLPIVVYRFKLETGYYWSFVNQEIEFYTGYSASQLLNEPTKTLFDFIHPQDQHRVRLELSKHDFSDGPLQLEYRIRHKNGRIFHVIDLIRKVSADDGSWMIEGLMNDQTEHFESLNRLQKLIDSQSNMVIISNAKQIQFANKAYYDFFDIEDHSTEKLQASGCLGKQFMKMSDYFHLGRLQEGENWIEALRKWSPDKRLVAMTNALGHQRTFKVEITDFDDEFYLISFFDVTDSQLEKQRWQYKASHDPLTGCYNRDFLEMNLSVFMRFVKREKALAGVLLLDIDHFKQVNDRFGHAEGDRVLSEMSNLIHRNIRDSDLFVRWGGEEFILLMAVDSDQSLEKVAKNIGRLVSENIESPSGSISVSIGGSILKDESDLEHAISRADAGLYYVKAHGRNGYLFVPEDV